ncbi:MULTISPECIES: mechanosensitive ion channel family protein [Vibrio]|jgi:small-conductance mechanosensitive channel|uniref:Small-conductance mechanosensitive channel n=1 Tax=Vibrio kanaloae TaxID=170673 RepID=A0A4U1Z2Z2_9VIBR|nr:MULTISPECIES: mechanosensitive ion channel family protein [Vibrio]KAB0465808.1 mechanosensitive ion channel family protein [Vibrio kanaloae]NOH99735.1 mechanosensitive ion channel family protein [Vibrio kanaloae]NOI98486.1 mechanosensitive ion channel family protein [Vibrio kanaloae]OEF14798.1 mechanosensitive ion channel protein MscS [Vibrio kanaloae 5S-149]TKE98017.1 mechanosensitive ion channel family protein [Vibrio kanaloae]
MVEYLQSNMWFKQAGLGLLLIVLYWVIKRLGQNWIEALAKNKRVALKRKQSVLKCFNITLFLLFTAIFTIILNLGFGDISLFLSSIFAVLGVALFAQWSILSNLTASVLIFFVFPYRIGDKVKVAEKDEDISGVIIDITMFHVILRHSSGNIITYPNNLILQKGVIKVLVEPELKDETIHTTLVKTEDTQK